MSQRILIVDDDHAIRDLIRKHLEKEGYEAFETENGMAASIWLNEHTADLAILDVVMPEMDGIELVYELKRRFPEMPILAISAGEHIMARDLCLQMMECLGANAILPKPFDLQKMVKAVKRLLEKKSSRM